MSTESDDTLQELLGSALRHAEPVPEHVLESARGAFTWRTIDEELAALVFDSATELTGVRDRGEARQLTFQGPGIEIEVMVSDPTTRRIVGQLVPAQTAAVELEAASGTITGTADHLGRFTIDGVPAEPVRLGVRVAGGVTVTTDWVVL
jgi:hypothetical protein